MDFSDFIDFILPKVFVVILWQRRILFLQLSLLTILFGFFLGAINVIYKLTYQNFLSHPFFVKFSVRTWFQNDLFQNLCVSYRKRACRYRFITISITKTRILSNKKQLFTSLNKIDQILMNVDFLTFLKFFHVFFDVLLPFLVFAHELFKLLWRLCFCELFSQHFKLLSSRTEVGVVMVVTVVLMTFTVLDHLFELFCDILIQVDHFLSEMLLLHLQLNKSVQVLHNETGLWEIVFHQLYFADLIFWKNVSDITLKDGLPVRIWMLWNCLQKVSKTL